MRLANDQVLAAEPDAVIPWSGWQMPVAKVVPHVRNELAVHRWDFSGDGEVVRGCWPLYCGGATLPNSVSGSASAPMLYAGHGVGRHRDAAAREQTAELVIPAVSVAFEPHPQLRQSLRAEFGACNTVDNDTMLDLRLRGPRFRATRRVKPPTRKAPSR